MTTRILILTPEFGPYAWGGLATYLHSIVPLISARGHEIDVVVGPTYSTGLSRQTSGLHGATSYRVVGTDNSLGEQFATFERGARSAYDVAYVQDQALRHIAIELKRQGRVRRIVAAAHLPSYGGFSYFDRPADEWASFAGEAELFRHCDFVVAPSRFAADLLLRTHRLRPANIRVNRLGVTSPAQGWERRAEADDRLRVLVVGRITKQKGLEDLRRVTELVQAPGRDAIRFRHLGRALPGEGTTAGLERVETLGFVDHDDVLGELARTDVLLSTSLHETFGLAVLEAMAYGAVPVGYRCGALPELVDSDRHGVLVDIGDHASLARALIELASDRTRLATLGERAAREAEQYHWDGHVERLLEDFEVPHAS